MRNTSLYSSLWQQMCLYQTIISKRGVYMSMNSTLISRTENWTGTQNNSCHSSPKSYNGNTTWYEDFSRHGYLFANVHLHLNDISTLGAVFQSRDQDIRSNPSCKFSHHIPGCPLVYSLDLTKLHLLNCKVEISFNLELFLEMIND